MGIGNILSYVSPALTTGANAAAGYAQGQAQSRQQELQGLVQMMMMARQAHQQDLENALKLAVTKHYGVVDNRPLVHAVPHVGLQQYDPMAKTWSTVTAEPPTVPRATMTTGSYVLNGKNVTLQHSSRGGYFDQQGNPISGIVTPYAPPQMPSIVQGAPTPGGQSTFFRIPKDAGAATPVPGVYSKPGAAGGGGALQMLAEGRMGFSFNDLKNSIGDMTAKENDPNFQKKLTSLTKGEMAAATTTPNSEAHGITGVIGNFAGQVLAGEAGKGLDPEIRQYMVDRQRVALAFTEAMPRPQQQLFHIEQGLSGMDVGWDPGSIAAVQSRRLTGYQVLGSILKQQGMIDGAGNYLGPQFRAGSGGSGIPVPGGNRVPVPIGGASHWDDIIPKKPGGG